MKFFASMFVILALFISTGAGAITITDTGSAAYWGGTAQGTSNKDVIGSDFAVDTLTATQSGGDFIEISVFWKNYINLGTYDVSKTWYEYCCKNY